MMTGHQPGVSRLAQATGFLCSVLRPAPRPSSSQRRPSLPRFGWDATPSPATWACPSPPEPVLYIYMLEIKNSFSGG